MAWTMVPPPHPHRYQHPADHPAFGGHPAYGGPVTQTSADTLRQLIVQALAAHAATVPGAAPGGRTDTTPQVYPHWRDRVLPPTPDLSGYPAGVVGRPDLPTSGGGSDGVPYDPGTIVEPASVWGVGGPAQHPIVDRAAVLAALVQAAHAQRQAPPARRFPRF